MSDVSTVPKLDGVKTRWLDDGERPYATAERGVPLVIEPLSGSGMASLTGFLSARTREIKAAIDEHGAVLLRGFEVFSERAFEEAVLSIRGVRPMSSFFMSELGREPAEGNANVFYTNKYQKTGGSLYHGGFHSENYYSTDVPALQVFWCKVEPWLGGETALVHMANAYAELDADLRAKLEREPFVAKRWPLSEVAARYELPEHVIESFFHDLGMVVEAGGQKFVVLWKPSVYAHPRNGKRSLQVNLGVELPMLSGFLHKLLQPGYKGPQWSLHRLAWKYPAVSATWTILRRASAVAQHPVVLGKHEWEGFAGKVGARLGRYAGKEEGAAPKPPPRAASASKIADKLERKEVVAIAKAVHRHCSVFTWKRGDVLLFDDMQMLHSGLPGMGPRVIRAMLCDPVPLKYPITSGLVEVRPDDGYQSIEERLRALKNTLS